MKSLSENAEFAERGKIISFAKEYYLREGFYKTSMDTLAAELRISKKTIYKSFPSKEILVEEIVDSIMRDILEATSRITSQNEDAVTKIRHIHQFVSSTLLRFSDKWLNDLKIHAPHLWVRIDEFRTRRMFSILSGIIQQGKKEGLFKDKPNEILITLFISSLRAIVNPDFLFYNKFSYQEAVNHTFDILFNGFLTKDGERTYRRKSKENKNENTV